MAYKMEYGMSSPFVSSTEKGEKGRKNSSKRWIIIGLVAVLLVVCVMTDVLIPGDAAVTKSAMRGLVSDIKDGEQVVDAFAAFCQTVLRGN